MGIFPIALRMTKTTMGMTKTSMPIFPISLRMTKSTMGTFPVALRLTKTPMEFWLVLGL